MAFADLIRDAAATYNDIADKIDASLGVVGHTNTISTVSTTSVSPTYVDVGIGDTAVTVNSGETVIVVCSLHASKSAVGFAYTRLLHVESSTVKNGPAFYFESTSTGGFKSLVTWSNVFTGLTGTCTFKMQWAVDTSGTVYSSQAWMTVIVLQTS